MLAENQWKALRWRHRRLALSGRQPFRHRCVGVQGARAGAVDGVFEPRLLEDIPVPAHTMCCSTKGAGVPALAFGDYDGHILRCSANTDGGAGVYAFCIR